MNQFQRTLSRSGGERKERQAHEFQLHSLAIELLGTYADLRSMASRVLGCLRGFPTASHFPGMTLKHSCCSVNAG
jgi:hypothetical protein